MEAEKMVMLNKLQIETAKKIISIGKELKKDDGQIKRALMVAYMESSLGVLTKNPDSTALGVYQYLTGSWKGHKGNVLNDEDSIRAFYQDQEQIENKFIAHKQSQASDPIAYSKRPADMKIPDNIPLEEYTYIKHHDGMYASRKGTFVRDSDSDKGINTYFRKNNETYEVLQELYKQLATNPQDAPVESPPKAKASLLDYYKKVPALPPVGPSKDVDGTAVPSPSLLDYYKDKPGGGGRAGLVHVSGYVRGEVQVSDYERSWPDGDRGNNLVR